MQVSKMSFNDEVVVPEKKTLRQLAQELKDEAGARLFRSELMLTNAAAAYAKAVLSYDESVQSLWTIVKSEDSLRLENPNPVDNPPPPWPL